MISADPVPPKQDGSTTLLATALVGQVLDGTFNGIEHGATNVRVVVVFKLDVVGEPFTQPTIPAVVAQVAWFNTPWVKEVLVWK